MKFGIFQLLVVVGGVACNVLCRRCRVLNFCFVLFRLSVCLSASETCHLTFFPSMPSCRTHLQSKERRIRVEQERQQQILASKAKAERQKAEADRALLEARRALERKAREREDQAAKEQQAVVAREESEKQAAADRKAQEEDEKVARELEARRQRQEQMTAAERGRVQVQ